MGKIVARWRAAVGAAQSELQAQIVSKRDRRFAVGTAVANIALQLIIIVGGIFGYYYTVIPVASKARLEEDYAKILSEKDKIQADVSRLEADREIFGRQLVEVQDQLSLARAQVDVEVKRYKVAETSRASEEIRRAVAEDEKKRATLELEFQKNQAIQNAIFNQVDGLVLCFWRLPDDFKLASQSTQECFAQHISTARKRVGFLSDKQIDIYVRTVERVVGKYSSRFNDINSEYKMQIGRASSMLEQAKREWSEVKCIEGESELADERTRRSLSVGWITKIESMALGNWRDSTSVQVDEMRSALVTELQVLFAFNK